MYLLVVKRFLWPFGNGQNNTRILLPLFLKYILNPSFSSQNLLGYLLTGNTSR